MRTEIPHRNHVLPCAFLAVALVLQGCTGSGISGFGGSKSQEEGDSGSSGAFDPDEVKPKILEIDSTGADFVDELGDTTLAVDGIDTTKGLAQILDARAIGTRYRAIFPSYRANAEFFPPGQQRLLGSVVQIGGAASWRSRWLTSITQEYLRLLRTVLNTACTQLVNEEWAAVTADAAKSAEMKLVRNLEKPSAADVNQFMTLMFGYELSGGKRHPGASDYAVAFSDNMAEYSGPDLGAFAKVNYKLMCIAIGSDLRVFVR